MAEWLKALVLKTSISLCDIRGSNPLPSASWKNVGSNFILARSGLFFILFSLLDFNLFVIIILKVDIASTTIIYYQIIEIMARENKIGENIKKYRTKQGLSQEDFAKKSGVKYTTLTKIESGVIKKPSVLVMAKIAKALGVNIENLIK